MKRTIITILQFFGVLGAIYVATQFSVFAQSLPINPKEYVAGDIPAPAQGQAGQSIVKEVVLSALNYIKVLTVVIAIGFLTIVGYRLIMAQGDEDSITKAKKSFIYILIALVLISMSQDIAKIFDMEKGTLLSSPQEILKRVHIFDKQVEIFITFVKYLIGAYAMLMLVVSGLKLISSGGKEEDTTNHKRGIMYSIGGLLLLYVGDIAINKVFYKVNREVYTGMTGVHPTVDPAEGVRQIIAVTNMIVSILGYVAVFMLIVASIMYATAGGKEENMEKAKRLIISIIVSMVLIFGAFAIVSTVITGKLDAAGALIG